MYDFARHVDCLVCLINKECEMIVNIEDIGAVIKKNKNRSSFKSKHWIVRLFKGD